MDNNTITLESIYGVFIKPQSYLNLLYLLLAFPLGLAYFIFLVTGLSLGVGLLILWVGLLILAGVLALSWVLVLFERQIAISLLNISIPPVHQSVPSNQTLFNQLKHHLGNPVTWKGMAFLFLKFPIGLVSFIVTITMGSLSLALLLAPIAYPWTHIHLGLMEVNSMPTAFVAFLLGLIVAPLSMHIFNFLAEWSGKFAQVMLGNPVAQSTPPVSPMPTVSDPFTPNHI